MCKYSLRPFRCTELPWGPDPEMGMSMHMPMHMSIHMFVHRSMHMSDRETGQLPDHPQSVLTINAEMPCGSTEHRMCQASIFIVSAIIYYYICISPHAIISQFDSHHIPHATSQWLLVCVCVCARACIADILVHNTAQRCTALHRAALSSTICITAQHCTQHCKQHRTCTQHCAQHCTALHSTVYSIAQHHTALSRC